jgi:hypothetical protein
MKKISTNELSSSGFGCVPCYDCAKTFNVRRLTKQAAQPLNETRVNKCRRIRAWLYEALRSHFSLNADWVQNHIANCPKCQRRFACVSRVNLALSLIKSQPHKLDLLMRANKQAIGVLKHSLREASKAQKLKIIQPEPKLLEICNVHKSSAANVAACIAILFLMKTGIFSITDTVQTQGQKAVKQYYVNQVGKDLANDIFTAGQG